MAKAFSEPGTETTESAQQSVVSVLPSLAKLKFGKRHHVSYLRVRFHILDKLIHLCVGKTGHRIGTPVVNRDATSRCID